MLKDLDKININKEKMIVALLAAIQFTHILDFVVIMPLGPILMRAFNMTPAQFAVLVSSYNISAAVMGFLLGLIADKYDRKLLLQLGFFFFSMATLFCAFSPNYSFLLISRIVAGAFGGAINTLVFSIVTDLIPFERRGKAMGTILASFSITSVIGIPIGLTIADYFGWKFSFIFITIFSFIIIGFGHFILPNVPRSVNQINIRQSIVRLLKISSKFEYIKAYLLIMSLSFSGFLIFPFLATYAVENVGLQESELKFIYLCGGILTIFSSKIVGVLTDKYGTIKLFIPTIILSIPAILTYTHVGQVHLYVLLTISTLFMGAMTSRVIPAMTLITSIPTPEERGGFMSVLHSSRSLSSALATLTAGFIITNTQGGSLLNFNKVGYLSVSISIISILLFIILYKSWSFKIEKST